MNNTSFQQLQDVGNPWVSTHPGAARAPSVRARAVFAHWFLHVAVQAPDVEDVPWKLNILKVENKRAIKTMGNEYDNLWLVDSENADNKQHQMCVTYQVCVDSGCLSTTIIGVVTLFYFFFWLMALNLYQILMSKMDFHPQKSPNNALATLQLVQWLRYIKHSRKKHGIDIQD